MQKILKKLLVCIIPALVFAGCAAAAANKELPEVTLFYASHCKVCLELKKEFLPKVKQQYNGKVRWQELETDANGGNLALLYMVFRENGFSEPRVPAIRVNKKLLVGKTDIEEKLVSEIEAAIASAPETAPLAEPAQNMHASSTTLTTVFSGMSATAIIGAGLIDGINPCAFAVIVFFVSFLAVYGYNRRDIVYVGSAYCLAVFLTYLGLGLGVFKALYALSGFYTAMKVFYYLTAGFCLLLFFLSIYDWLNYTKTGSSEGMLLQLPKSFKLNINRITGAFMRGKNRSPLYLLGASFTVGVAVSLIEAVCTGQVYVPTIVFIMKDPALRSKAIWYLLLYNFMFVLPLVAVFLLSFAGFESGRFSALFKKHLGLTKILLALVFLALGLMLLFNI